MINTLRTAAAATLLAATGWLVAATPAGATGGHTVYSSIAHPSADYLVDQGAQRAATVYDHWGTSCTASGCTNIPSRADFLDQVADAVSSFRTDDVLILDFESLVLHENGTDTAAAQNSADQLLIFISWIRSAYPEARIGCYDYDWSTSYQDAGITAIRRQLFGSGGFDMFNPTLYQRWSSQSVWDANLQSAISNDRAVSDKPIVPFISPYRSGENSQGLLSDAEWAHQLDTVDANADGSIVWNPSAAGAVVPDARWVQTLVSFVRGG